MKKYTDEEAREIIKQVEAERDNGLNVVKACKKVKTSASKYQFLKARLNKTHQVIVHAGSDYPVTQVRPYAKKLKPTGKCIVMIADISSVAALVREFT